MHDGRIYTVKLYCDQNYPGKVNLLLRMLVLSLGLFPVPYGVAAQPCLGMQAPQVRFETRVNLSCVGHNGVVSLSACLVCAESEPTILCCMSNQCRWMPETFIFSATGTVSTPLRPYWLN